MTKDPENTWVPIAAIAILAAVAAGILFRAGPLESQRPPQGSEGTADFPGGRRPHGASVAGSSVCDPAGLVPTY